MGFSFKKAFTVPKKIRKLKIKDVISSDVTEGLAGMIPGASGVLDMVKKVAGSQGANKAVKDVQNAAKAKGGRNKQVIIYRGRK